MGKRFGLELRLCAFTVKVRAWGYTLTVDCGWYDGNDMVLLVLEILKVEPSSKGWFSWLTILNIQILKFTFGIMLDDKAQE